MKNLVIRLLANAVALGVAILLVPGITLHGPTTGRRILTLLVVAAIFGVANAFVKPILQLLSCVFIALTLGLRRTSVSCTLFAL